MEGKGGGKGEKGEEWQKDDEENKEVLQLPDQTLPDQSSSYNHCINV